jgi:hypothetical protein
MGPFGMRMSVEKMLACKATPKPGTIYSAGPRRAGLPADAGEERHYPLEAMCAGCGEVIVLRQFLAIGADGEWQHAGRKTGEG